MSTKLQTAYDVNRIRADFPILQLQVRGKPLVYLDNAATTQKPRSVIEALSRYYSEGNANIHRGVHFLSEHATAAYEAVRAQAAGFLGAADPAEIIFVRGTTEAINLVAQAYGRTTFARGDEIVVTTMEHHSNIVPWQLLCEQTGAVLRVAPIDDQGEVLLEEYAKLLGPRTRLVAVAHVSNALGTINPVREMTTLAKRHGAIVLVDGAQAAAHLKIEVRALGCDFYTLSGHKMFGPTGIGCLWGRRALLEAMPPYQGGGDMIASVSFEKTTFNHLPHKFEAGTPHIAGVIGLGAAMSYLQNVGLEAIGAHEEDLRQYAMERLGSIRGLRFIGTARHKAAVVGFTLEGVHPHDVGTILDQEGVAVRAGHHCAQPLMERFGVPATVRASFALYNTRAEVDALARALHQVQEIFHC
ncbi:MAG TPA: cysteine desulfurase [Candidatus Krumholzibacteria bacterium]|nr:cysteine desulfurase [Candidatus Krumholzibacteria bacterium]